MPNPLDPVRVMHVHQHPESATHGVDDVFLDMRLRYRKGQLGEQYQADGHNPSECIILLSASGRCSDCAHPEDRVTGKPMGANLRLDEHVIRSDGGFWHYENHSHRSVCRCQLPVIRRVQLTALH